MHALQSHLMLTHLQLVAAFSEIDNNVFIVDFELLYSS